MVNHSTDSLGAIFAALADPTRRAILERLARGEASVTELAEPFHVSLPAISKQLRVLERAGLLLREKQGRTCRCRLVAGPMREAAQWLADYRQYWERQLDSLADYLDQLREEEHHDPSDP
jgi:DNA-binding transcriptional ArsR family regulator